MAFEYVGKCQRCHVDSGYLDGKRVHTVAGLIFSDATYNKEGALFCKSPIFEGEEIGEIRIFPRYTEIDGRRFIDLNDMNEEGF